MISKIDRRQFAKLAGLGGVVFASGLGAPGSVARAAEQDFYFVQLSDTHWGFQGPPNPEAANTLDLAIESVNTLGSQPDFIVFTGDLTHTTDDDNERRNRMKVFKEKIAKLKVQKIYLMPGEHDASLDEGKAFMEFFGKTHYTFDHKGVHFIVLDNVSDPRAQLGDEQLAWLADDLKKQKKDQKIVVFTHRPLFDLFPQWDWATRDGAKAVDLLMPYTNVTVFYGHIHQENHHMTGHIAHHAAKSLVFPLPAPGSQPQRTPLPWNAAMPFSGLGWRDIEVATTGEKIDIHEMPVKVA
jgi:3',5'-cyclic AMP phosphodiesterase CpdA